MGLASSIGLGLALYLPGMDRNPIIEYKKRHIPNARFFDIDDISDNRSDLPHMVPPIEKFMSKVRNLGVGDGHQVELTMLVLIIQFKKLA